MKPTYRYMSKIRKVGNSLVVTLPHQMRRDWPMSENDQLVLYQTREALVIVPLEAVIREGPPQALEVVERLTRRLPH